MVNCQSQALVWRGENSDSGQACAQALTEAALVIFEINARIAARAALQNVVFTSINTGVAAGAMGQKMRFITGPGRTDTVTGFAPATSGVCPDGMHQSSH
ncbi:Uncharacterised protein [Escherichia coli]|uniref:Uncharacterized protein n=1 Tax=Escherichia coli TaxID=562 RepID=A0A376U7B2_ECOLX|nr:Uncharacterised protein [Escherichia coli]